MEKDNRTLLEDLGIDVSRIRNGKTLCPKCSPTRKKKDDPCLNVSIIKGVYNCWNDGCGFSGHVGKSEYVSVEKVYNRPRFVNTSSLSNDHAQYYSVNRGISQSTLNKCKVTESLTGLVKWANFNYFRNGELVNVKYRAHNEKKFRLEKDAELIFYGLDDVKDSDWCVIVEGEIDKLSFAEAGIMEVLSVPNGASNSDKANLEYLDNCIEYFANKKKVILATDNDSAGTSLRDELARRIGYDVCFKVNFNGFKDANELLVAKGIDSIKELIREDNLIDFPIDGIIEVRSIWDRVQALGKEGLKRGYITKRSPQLDEFLSYVLGQLMLLTGIPNHGKSPFALFIMACLSLEHGMKWALFTPEHKPLEIFIVKICELLLGRKLSIEKPMSSTEEMLAMNFITNHFYFIEPEDESYTLDNILDKLKDLVKRKGVNGFLLDPWNKLEHNISKGDNETMYISKELDKIIKVDQKYKLFTILVAHPAKMRKIFKSELFEVPSLYDISGSANWFNKPDIGVTFYRNFGTGNSEVYIQKMKYDHIGKQGKVKLKYNANNGRFGVDYDNSNWLLGKPERPEPEEEKTFEEKIEAELDNNTPIQDLPF